MGILRDRTGVGRRVCGKGGQGLEIVWVGKLGKGGVKVGNNLGMGLKGWLVGERKLGEEEE